MVISYGDMIPNGHKNSFVLFKKSKETSFLLSLMDFYEIFTLKACTIKANRFERVLWQLL